MSDPNQAYKTSTDPRAMATAPPGYMMQPGYATQPGMQPPGYTQYAVPVTVPMQAYPQQHQQEHQYGYMPGAVAPPGYPVPPVAVYSGMPGQNHPGYSGMPPQHQPGYGYGAPLAAGGISFPQMTPMGQLAPEFIAQAAFGAFSRGLSPAMYDGMARSMGIAPVDPQDASDPRNQVKRGDWASGLFSCCDYWIPNGCMACVCPCISLAQIYTRLGNMRYQATIFQFASMWIFPVIARAIPEIMFRSMGDGDFSFGVPVFMNIVVLFPLLVTGMMVARLRSLLRIRFKIPGSCCGDCVAGCCLWPCAIAQMATHVKSYTPGSCSFDPPDMLPPFV